ncbi:hypothetical protein ACEWY4_019038 [Coilia grayii]|uniref:Chemokine interleukin-8-like domain-containing protein n=1 Tax=Coilia grayii TaxID=363190 RepID=A0ABD1JEX2_9TELE
MLHSVSQNQLISVLILTAVLLHYTSGVQSHDPKNPTCCKRVSPARIVTKIDDCIIAEASHQCLPAVIFFTQGTYYCSTPNARWVIKKLKDLKNEGRPCRNSTTGTV